VTKVHIKLNLLTIKSVLMMLDTNHILKFMIAFLA